MKGPALNFMATIATFVVSPDRFSIASLNVLFLLIGQFSLFSYLKKHDGTACALLGTGLFLLVGTHYLGVGGLNDMRRDYLCMVVSGISFFCVVDWLAEGGKSRLLSSILALFASSLMRSVSLFYWAGGLGIVFALVVLKRMLFRTAVSQESSTQSLVVRTGVMFVVSLCVIASNVLGNLRDFWTYYAAHKVDGEEAMRWREFDVHNFVERLLYYPNSFVQHFSQVVWVSIAILLVSAVVFVLKHKVNWSEMRQCLVRATDRSLPLSVALLSSLAVAAVAILTYYSPNPIVIGFLGLMLCVCLSRSIYTIWKLSLDNRIAVCAGALVALLGLANFAQQVRSPAFRPHGDVISAKASNDVLQRVKTLVESRNGASVTVYWALVHDGINDRNFDVYWYETARKGKPEGLHHSMVVYFPATTWETASIDLRNADVVVIPTDMSTLPPGAFEYEGNASVRRLLPKYQQELAKSFSLVETFSLPNHNWTVGVFERRVPRK